MTMAIGCSNKKVTGQVVEPDSSKVELDSLSPYSDDENQREVTLSDDSTTLSKPHHIYVQKDSDWVSSCYADGFLLDLPGGNGLPAMATYEMGDYVYVVGDRMPNGNFFTIRFALCQVNRYTLAVKEMGAFPAIHFDKHGYKVAVPRVTNPDADWADQIIVMHDEYYDAEGRLIRKDKREYDYSDMEKVYGEKLLSK